MDDLHTVKEVSSLIHGMISLIEESEKKQGPQTVDNCADDVAGKQKSTCDREHIEIAPIALERPFQFPQPVKTTFESILDFIFNGKFSDDARAFGKCVNVSELCWMLLHIKRCFTKIMPQLPNSVIYEAIRKSKIKFGHLRNQNISVSKYGRGKFHESDYTRKKTGPVISKLFKHLPPFPYKNQENFQSAENDFSAVSFISCLESVLNQVLELRKPSILKMCLDVNSFMSTDAISDSEFSDSFICLLSSHCNQDIVKRPHEGETYRSDSLHVNSKSCTEEMESLSHCGHSIKIQHSVDESFRPISHEQTNSHYKNVDGNRNNPLALIECGNKEFTDSCRISHLNAEYAYLASVEGDQSEYACLLSCYIEGSGNQVSGNIDKFSGTVPLQQNKEIERLTDQRSGTCTVASETMSNLSANNEILLPQNDSGAKSVESNLYNKYKCLATEDTTAHQSRADNMSTFSSGGTNLSTVQNSHTSLSVSHSLTVPNGSLNLLDNMSAMQGTKELTSPDSNVVHHKCHSSYTDWEQTVPDIHMTDFDEISTEISLYENKVETSHAESSGKTNGAFGNFSWKYVPSASEDDDENPSVTREETDTMVLLHPITSCLRPLRLGLSRKQIVKRLHKNVQK